MGKQDVQKKSKSHKDEGSSHSSKDKKDKKDKKKSSYSDKEKKVVKSSGISYLKEIEELKKTIPFWDNMFSSDISDEDRQIAWTRLEVIGEPLIEKYSWAIPDKKAIHICKHFSPLIELGCGRGYWAKLLRDFDNTDIIAVDKYEKRKKWTNVENGDPYLALSKSSNSNRTLLLSYPDQGEAMAIECLRYYHGQYIIHIGELLVSGTGTKCGGLQRPWGKTTSADFQVTLVETFHCVLQYKLNSYPFSNDYLTVW